MGARWIWNTLADNACSHHIPSLAPAVALPAPRHDRRRTGAAGSPPGGFPFVELTPCGCEMHVRLRPVARVGLRYRLRPAPHKTPLIPAQAGIQGPGLGPRFRGDERKREFRDTPEQIDPHPRAPSLDSGNSLCYRTQPLRGHRGGRFGRIAQLVEQLTLNQRVPGSSPGAPTIDLASLFSVFR